MLLRQVTPVSHPHNEHALIRVQERKRMLQNIQCPIPKQETLTEMLLFVQECLMVSLRN